MAKGSGGPEGSNNGEQSQEGHQDSKIGMNEWHGEANAGGGYSPGPYSLVPLKGMGLPRWKLILLVAFFSVKVPYSYDLTGTLKGQMSKKSAYASKPTQAKHALRRASIQPPDGSCRHQIKLFTVEIHISEAT